MHLFHLEIQFSAESKAPWDIQTEKKENQRREAGNMTAVKVWQLREWENKYHKLEITLSN